MQELISETQAEWIVGALCVLILVVGALVAWKRTRAVRPTVFFAALGPLVWALWRVYNAIENHYGLDSVKALAINAGLFLAVAVALPYVYAALCDRPSPEHRKR